MSSQQKTHIYLEDGAHVRSATVATPETTSEENEQLENEQDRRVRKMDADQFYTSKGGKYLKGTDIAGQEWEVTIADAQPEAGFKAGDPERIALTYNEIDQKLTLNKGNYLMVKENTGTSNTMEWIDKKLVLYGTRDLNPEGTMVDVVRIRPPEREVKRVVPGKAKVSNPAPFNDDIPFGK
jgi:hypothetical protein